MQRVGLDEFARAPVGRFVAGATWAHFCASPELWGVILWGRPGKRDALDLGRSLVLELAPGAVAHASVIDASRLEAGDPSAFRAAERYLTQFHEALRAKVTRLALIRATGMSGALVSGAFDVLPRPYPVHVVGTARDAFAALGLADRAALLAEIHADASGTPRAVGALRAHLDGHLARPALTVAARRLGVSVRSLQRLLSDAGTTFTAEVADARVRAARRLLLDTDAPLADIARDIGCSSLPHFSTLFRRRTGESPSAFRARGRTR